MCDEWGHRTRELFSFDFCVSFRPKICSAQRYRPVGERWWGVRFHGIAAIGCERAVLPQAGGSRKKLSA